MSALLWVNGVRQDTVSAVDRGLAYGDGLFATMRCSKGRVLFLDAHLGRAVQTSQRLGMPWQASAQLIGLLSSIAIEQQQELGTDFCIKLLLSRGVGGRGYQLPEHVSVTEVVSVHPMPGHYRHWQTNGIALQLSPMRLGGQTRLAGMKHLNRLEQVLIKAQVLDKGFDDWLVLDTQEQVIESSMANLFLIKDKQVVTPSMHLAGVAGVMREQLIYWFIEAGFNVAIRPVIPSELSQFDHVLLSNSLFGVVGVNRIEQCRFAPSALPLQINQALTLSL